jgi:tocopherol O-methyltransferase
LESRADSASELRRSIERHYDSLALLYRFFWGRHIHHGLWLSGDSAPTTAQEQLVAYLAKRARIRRGASVLDVGCGYGASARWLSTHLDCRVTGVTVSRKQARLAKRYNTREALDGRTSVVRADAATLPFDDAAFDVVWVIECIEHLVDKQSFVHDAARMLRPGGRFALCAWQRTDSAGEDDELVRRVCESFLCPSLATEREFEEWCSAAGMQVRCVEDLTANVRATWDILMKRISRSWLAPARMLAGGDVRRFLEGFPAIARAYDSGAMSYGLLVAAKPQGNPRRRPW